MKLILEYGSLLLVALGTIFVVNHVPALKRVIKPKA